MTSDPYQIKSNEISLIETQQSIGYVKKERPVDRNCQDPRRKCALLGCDGGKGSRWTKRNFWSGKKNRNFCHQTGLRPFSGVKIYRKQEIRSTRMQRESAQWPICVPNLKFLACVYGQRTKWRRIIADNFYRNRLCKNVTDDRQTDGRTDGRRHTFANWS